MFLSEVEGPQVNRVFYLVHRHPLITSALLFWVILVLWQDSPLALISEFGLFGVLGIIGAVFANATGAGGGVVFVPFFNQLAFPAQSVVATSFAIQCCGMTAGAITWWKYKTNLHRHDIQWSALRPGLMLTVPASLCGVWFAQFGPHYLDVLAPVKGGLPQLHLGFGLFSIALAVAIFASIPLLKRTRFRCHNSQLDIVALLFIGFFGGMVTAWLSIGVGELVAVYLIIRGFNITMAIALAVILSAATVWSAVGYHLLVSHAVVWSVVLFAGAGAILGGMLAKYVVLAFSPQKLKLFFGTWVLVLGVSGLPVF